MKLVFMMPALVTVVEIVSASVLQLLRMLKNVPRLRPVFSGELLIYAVSNSKTQLYISGYCQKACQINH